tara:strand:- start:605 stop:925 length:321 start_codon:yes stop_codon:yes gene_type:complete
VEKRCIVYKRSDFLIKLKNKSLLPSYNNLFFSNKRNISTSCILRMPVNDDDVMAKFFSSTLFDVVVDNKLPPEVECEQVGKRLRAERVNKNPGGYSKDKGILLPGF